MPKACLGFITASFFWGFATTAVIAETSEQSFGIHCLINEVVSRNAGLTASQLRARAKESLIVSAGSLDDPWISYSAAPLSIGDSIPSKLGNALGVRQVIEVSQTIPWPGKRSLRTNQMQAVAEVMQFSAADLRLSLVAQSRALWAQWWYVNQALLANAEHLNLSAELRVVAETQYANGIGLQQDVLQIQTHEVQLEHQHLVLEQERRRLQSHINHLLNRAPATALGLPLGGLETPELPDREALEQWLLETHPGLLGLEAESKVARLKLRLVEKDDYPDLQFNLRYNELRDPVELRLQVGVSLNIPLDFGKRSARKSAAEFEYHSTQLDIVNERSQLRSALEDQLSRAEQARHGIQLIQTELLPKTEQTVNATLANYESGGGNFNAVIEAQEQLLDMRLLESSSYAEQFIAISEIDRLSGGQLWPPGETQ